MTPLGFFLSSSLGLVLAVDFLSIGDFGLAEGAKKIVPHMTGHLAGDPEWILGVGDNFYGAIDFKTKFEDVFVGDKLTVPWYVTTGNHDYYQGQEGLDAELAYSHTSKRWHLPQLYYDKVLTGKDGVTVHLLAVDTWRLNGGDDLAHLGRARSAEESKPSASSPGVLQPELRPAEPPAAEATATATDEAQLDWLNETLTRSTADWKIVMGHFPVYSCHQPGELPSLIRHLLPLLQEHQVDVYLNGHHHILQHLHKDGIHFLGSGAGARKLGGSNVNYPGLKGLLENSYGFMKHTATTASLKTDFIDEHGRVAYSFTIHKEPEH